MGAHVALVKIEEQKISSEKAKKFIASEKNGAESIFVGKVRNENSGKQVVGVTYDAHDQAAIKSFESECKKASFPFGYHIIKPEFDQVLNKIDQGYTFIGFSLDFFFLGEKARTEMKELKNAK